MQELDQELRQVISVILPALRENGIDETLAIYLVHGLATQGTSEQCKDRILSLLDYMVDHEGRITAKELKDLSLELLCE